MRVYINNEDLNILYIDHNLVHSKHQYIEHKINFAGKKRIYICSKTMEIYCERKENSLLGISRFFLRPVYNQLQSITNLLTLHKLLHLSISQY